MTRPLTIAAGLAVALLALASWPTTAPAQDAAAPATEEAAPAPAAAAPAAPAPTAAPAAAPAGNDGAAFAMR